MKTRSWVVLVIIMCILSLFGGVMFGHSREIAFRGGMTKALNSIAGEHEGPMILIATEGIGHGSVISEQMVKAVPLSSYTKKLIYIEEKEAILGHKLVFTVEEGDAIMWDMLSIDKRSERVRPSK